MPSSQGLKWTGMLFTSNTACRRTERKIKIQKLQSEIQVIFLKGETCWGKTISLILWEKIWFIWFCTYFLQTKQKCTKRDSNRIDLNVEIWCWCSKFSKQCEKEKISPVKLTVELFWWQWSIIYLHWCKLISFCYCVYCWKCDPGITNKARHNIKCSIDCE